MDLWALSDLCTPWCIHVVVTLRIAEHLAAGITRIDDLATAAGAHAESLARVLRHLIGKGLFAEPAPGQFALNDDARALLDPGARLGFDLDGIGGRMARAWSSLLTAVETGAPAYDEVFGRPFWDDLAAHPHIAASFDALMGPAGHGPPDPDIPLTGGWDSVRTVVDVGGGTGSLLAAILRAHPAVHGTLVDLPATVAALRRSFRSRGRGRAGHRRRPELLRPVARRRRSLPAEEGPRRLARSRSHRHSDAMRRSRASPAGGLWC